MLLGLTSEELGGQVKALGSPCCQAPQQTGLGHVVPSSYKNFTFNPIRTEAGLHADSFTQHLEGQETKINRTTRTNQTSATNMTSFPPSPPQMRMSGLQIEMYSCAWLTGVSGQKHTAWIKTHTFKGTESSQAAS